MNVKEDGGLLSRQNVSVCQNSIDILEVVTITHTTQETSIVYKEL